MFNSMAKKALYMEIARITCRYAAGGLAVLGAATEVTAPVASQEVTVAVAGVLAFGVEALWIRAKKAVAG